MLMEIKGVEYLPLLATLVYMYLCDIPANNLMYFFSCKYIYFIKIDHIDSGYKIGFSNLKGFKSYKICFLITMELN